MGWLAFHGLLVSTTPNTIRKPIAATRARYFMFTSEAPCLETPVNQPARPPVHGQQASHDESHDPKRDAPPTHRRRQVAAIGRARRVSPVRLVERVRQQGHADPNEIALK